MTARSAVLRAVLLCAAAVLVWLQQETIPCGGFSARLFRSNAALSRRTSCRAAGARQPSAVRGLGSQVRAVSVRRTIVAHQRRARTPGRPPLGFRPASCMFLLAGGGSGPPPCGSGPPPCGSGPPPGVQDSFGTHQGLAVRPAVWQSAPRFGQA